MPSTHRYTKSIFDRSRCANAFASSCHCVVSLVTVAADNPAPESRNCSNAGVKSNDDNPCKYSNGNTSATFGDFRDHAGRIFDENRCRSLVSGFIRLSFTRGAVTVTAPAPVTTSRCWW